MNCLELFLFLLFNPIPVIFIIISAVRNTKRNNEHQKSSYYQITKKSLDDIERDAGAHGEYLIYQNLKSFETTGAKFLFNLYIPKADGTTTEIDMVMISQKGVFVFESKNYQGWIFGDEHHQKWYQTISMGWNGINKEEFYNPIMQNKTHIKHLQRLFQQPIPMHSIIVFSDRCEIKNLKIYSREIGIVNTYNVFNAVVSVYNYFSNYNLTYNDIQVIYNTLFPYTQLSDTVKALHNYNLQVKHNNNNLNNAPIIPVFVPQNPQPSTPLKCPWCNGDLVLRTAKKGTNTGGNFYGCSNYPKCNYKKNM